NNDYMKTLYAFRHILMLFSFAVSVCQASRLKNQNNQNDMLEVEIEENDPSIVQVLSETKGQKTVVMKKIGLIGRMKIVLSGDQIFHVFGRPRHPQLSRNINWQGGGFFKYYKLEQYEETLANCKYEDGDLFNVPGRNPYQEYVFMKDEKMLKALEIDYKNNKVKVDLSKLYPNTPSANASTPLREGNTPSANASTPLREGIDIAETLSNLTGKWIKKLKTKDSKLKSVVFDDGTEIDVEDLDYKLIKPLIWWEE
ncbi:MAG: hypothetical protein N2558_05050, partial [Patescibacteria group bacterium]|nr:hypothetical protein [Patescibacteria group bacterium]